MSVFRLALLGILLLSGTLTLAQENDDTVVFILNDTVMAQSIAENTLIQGERLSVNERGLIPTDSRNIYTFEQSPLHAPLSDGYGFHQGVWSDDRTHFVFLAIASNSPNYRVILWADGQQQILISGQVGIERGYLVPVDWRETGELVLIERHMLHNLRDLRVWHYNPQTLSLIGQAISPLVTLTGNSATLANGWVFIGFDMIGMQGYLFDSRTNGIVRFTTSLALQESPSVFELYPIEVMGVVSMAEFQAWLETPPVAESSPIPRENIPFLYWMLPDYARSVTCYPDSEWVALNFTVECPGLQTPRDYQGHEGTDIGGKPMGLSVGTPVYAATQGLIITMNTDCLAGDVSCGDAYGNYVLLEHAIVRDNNIETWFTGYAHLQTVLVDNHSYIGELGIPIALSGDTGLGGAHLHFEVRSPHQNAATNWLDPWDNRAGTSLWIGGNDTPIAAVTVFPPPTLLVCQSVDDNNIRSGPDTTYDIVATTISATDYEVFQIQTIVFGEVPGNWYHIRWQGTERTGWIWSDLLQGCTSVAGENG